MIQSICEIPLYGRDGSVRGRVLVDEDDWLHFVRFRWSLNDNGYAVSTASRPNPIGPVPRVTHYLHRLVAGLKHGDGHEVDHINRDRLDCRRANLRSVTAGQNRQNLTPRKRSTSGYRGVSWHKGAGKWLAEAKVAGKHYYLGLFADEVEAGAAAAACRARHMPYSEEARSGA
jgi:hypothetical protein